MALLPKFTLRQLLLLVLVMAVLFTCFAGAARGSVIAFGLSRAMVLMFVPVLAFAVAYWILYSLAFVTAQWTSPANPVPVTNPIVVDESKNIWAAEEKSQQHELQQEKSQQEKSP